MSNLNMTIQKVQAALMQVCGGGQRPVQVDDAVQSLNTRRCYAVASINPETGRPNLCKHGHRPIHNANPAKYRIIERLEVARG